MQKRVKEPVVRKIKTKRIKKAPKIRGVRAAVPSQPAPVGNADIVRVGSRASQAGIGRTGSRANQAVIARTGSRASQAVAARTGSRASQAVINRTGSRASQAVVVGRSGSRASLGRSNSQNNQMI